MHIVREKFRYQAWTRQTHGMRNESSTPCKYTQKVFFTGNLVKFQQASEPHRECVRASLRLMALS